jgi:hypothetical protein
MILLKMQIGPYLFFSCCCLTSFLFVWFFVPETKGLLTLLANGAKIIDHICVEMSLEKMDDLFGVTALVREKVGTAQLAALDTIDRKGDRGEYAENVERVQ